MCAESLPESSSTPVAWIDSGLSPLNTISTNCRQYTPMSSRAPPPSSFSTERGTWSWGEPKYTFTSFTSPTASCVSCLRTSSYTGKQRDQMAWREQRRKSLTAPRRKTAQTKLSPREAVCNHVCDRWEEQNKPGELSVHDILCSVRLWCFWVKIYLTSMRKTLLFLASSTRSFTCLEFIAKGFSHNTFFPALRNRRPTHQCSVCSTPKYTMSVMTGILFVSI